VTLVPPTYCFDTSAMIAAARFYPRSLAPELWTTFDKWIDRERMIAPRDVLDELARQDDDLYVWAKGRPKMFLEWDTNTQVAVAAIIRDHPSLVNMQRNRSTADPAVIATAHSRSAAVVSQEIGGSLKAVKIPDVCRARGLRHLDLPSLLLGLGWKLSPPSS
jgi:hypothetical protein